MDIHEIYFQELALHINSYFVYKMELRDNLDCLLGSGSGVEV